MQKKPLVVFITNCEQKGGMPRHLAELGNIIRHKFDLHFILYGKTSWVDNMPWSKVSFIPRPKAITIKAKSPYEYYLRKTTNLIRKLKPEIVYCVNSPTYIIAPFAAHPCNVPVVITQRDTAQIDTEYLGYIDQINLTNKLADRIVVVSKNVKRSLLLYEKISPKKITMIYNGVDVDKIYKEAQKNLGQSRSFLKLSKNEYAIGLISRVIDGKGIDIFLRAAKKISEKNIPAKFIIIGQGPSLRKMVRLARSLKIQHLVIFTGFQEDVYRLLGALDIIVCPSILDEGHSLSLLESMAAKRPIICSNTSPFREVITHKKTGILVPAGNALSLSQAIIRLVNNKKLSKQLAINAHNHVKNKFDIKKKAEAVSSLFNNLLLKC